MHRLLLVLFLLCGCFRSGGTGAPELDQGVADRGARDASMGAPPPDAFLLDQGSIDAGTAQNCEAQDVQPAECSSTECNTFGPLPRAYWNGHRCEQLGCTESGDTTNNCVGDDCDATFETLEACQRAYAECTPSLCRATGGMWRFWGECDCGFFCGENGNCDACEGPSCDCGPNANFDPELGCVESDECARPPFVEPPEDLCARTRGSWGAFCEHSRCGVRSVEACANPACDCPGPTIFDSVRGCIEAEACFLGAGRCDFPRVECPLGSACGADGFCVTAVCL